MNSKTTKTHARNSGELCIKRKGIKKVALHGLLILFSAFYCLRVNAGKKLTYEQSLNEAKFSDNVLRWLKPNPDSLKNNQTTSLTLDWVSNGIIAENITNENDYNNVTLTSLSSIAYNEPFLMTYNKIETVDDISVTNLYCRVFEFHPFDHTLKQDVAETLLGEGTNLSITQSKAITEGAASSYYPIMTYKNNSTGKISYKILSVNTFTGSVEVINDVSFSDSDIVLISSQTPESKSFATATLKDQDISLNRGSLHEDKLHTGPFVLNDTNTSAKLEDSSLLGLAAFDDKEIGTGDYTAIVYSKLNDGNIRINLTEITGTSGSEDVKFITDSGNEIICYGNHFSLSKVKSYGDDSNRLYYWASIHQVYNKIFSTYGQVSAKDGAWGALVYATQVNPDDTKGTEPVIKPISTFSDCLLEFHKETDSTGKTNYVYNIGKITEVSSTSNI